MKDTTIIRNRGGYNVLVVYGGISERIPSLETGKNVAKALRENGHDVVLYDFTNIQEFIKILDEVKPDIVFNALHGKFGEDGKIQGLLDLLHIPYTHSGAKASTIGMDKTLTKKLAQSINIPVAPSQTMLFKDFIAHGTDIAMPYVIKPNNEGSSVGVYIIKEQQDLNNLEIDDNVEVLIEKFIDGREFTVGIINGKPIEVTEICPLTGFYNFENKYQPGKSKHILPADVSSSIRAKLMSYTKQLYDILGCRSVARADFRYNPTDGIILLEINTQPGMTSTSLLPEQAAYKKQTFNELCEAILQSAQFDY